MRMTNDSNYDMITHIVTQQIRRFHLFYGKNIEFMQRLLTGQENGEDYEVRQVDAPRTLITPKELALIRLGELGGEDDIAQLRSQAGKLLVYDGERYNLFHDRFRTFLVGANS